MAWFNCNSTPGGITNQITEFSQVNAAAAEYLAAAEASYTDANVDTVSVIADYATSDGKDWPLGLAIPTQDGTRYMQDEADGRGGSIANKVGGASVIYNTVPGHAVQYLVKNDNGKVIGNGRVKSTGQLRMIRFSGYVKNCRDLGGWGCDGGTVKYGLMYRCAAPGVSLEPIDESYAELANVRHHIDVRDNTAFATSPFGARVYYKHCPMTKGYVDAVKPDGVDYAMTKKVIRDIFEAAEHGDGSIYHCSLGRDRTGTVSFLLLALLGVSRKHIDMDYELSGFSSVSGSTVLERTNSAYIGMANYVMGLGKDTLRDNVVTWALKAGITMNEINAFRAAAVNGNPEVLDAGNYQIPYTLTQTLTGCASNASQSIIYEGNSLAITISPAAGYRMDSIAVTMGGTDITSSVVSGNVISIPSISGDVVVTATAVIAYTNVLPLSTNADGTLYEAGHGWKTGGIWRADNGEHRDTPDYYETSGFIPVTKDDVFRIKNYEFNSPATAYDNIGFYDSSHNFIGSFTASSSYNPLPQWISDGQLTGCVGTAETTNFADTKKNSIAYMRLSFKVISDETIVTVNEEIV